MRRRGGRFLEGERSPRAGRGRCPARRGRAPALGALSAPALGALSAAGPERSRPEPGSGCPRLGTRVRLREAGNPRTERRCCAHPGRPRGAAGASEIGTPCAPVADAGPRVGSARPAGALGGQRRAARGRSGPQRSLLFSMVRERGALCSGAGERALSRQRDRRGVTAPSSAARRQGRVLRPRRGGPRGDGLLFRNEASVYERGALTQPPLSGAEVPTPFIVSEPPAPGPGEKLTQTAGPGPKPAAPRLCEFIRGAGAVGLRLRRVRVHLELPSRGGPGTPCLRGRPLLSACRLPIYPPFPQALLVPLPPEASKPSAQ